MYSEEPEARNIPFRGGEMGGRCLISRDIVSVLTDALNSVFYTQPWFTQGPTSPDRSYRDNKGFWKDALANRHFPSAYVHLQDFYLTEWLPFAPGRYFTPEAAHEREKAAGRVSESRDEYLPEGKYSMVRGGIGTIRLGEKVVRGAT